jgi:hypothetical protein
MRHNRPRILDQLDVAIPEPHRAGEQFNKPGVHARQHDQTFVGILIREKFLVFLMLNEGPVVIEDF